MVESREHLNPIVAGFDVFRAREYDCGTCHRQIVHCYQKLVDEGQSPKRGLEWAIFSCADSRKPPEDVYGLRAGQAFTFRNLGNSVPRTPQEDIQVWAAISYAVNLGIKKFVVAGHEDCGAMKAAAYGHNDPILAEWRRQKGLFTRRLGRLPIACRHDHAAALNVALSVRNIDRYMDKLAATNGDDWQRPIVSGLLFKLGEGNLYLVNRQNAALEPLTHYALRPDRGRTPSACPPIVAHP